MKPVLVEIWRRDPPGYLPIQWKRAECKLAMSPRAAARWARTKLPALVGSDYTLDRDIGRCDFAAVIDRAGKRRLVLPEVYRVPSVGELGWTP